MPEPIAWRYQKLIKPIFEPLAKQHTLRGHVLTCSNDEALEDGFVEFVLETVPITFNTGRRFV